MFWGWQIMGGKCWDVVSLCKDFLDKFAGNLGNLLSKSSGWKWCLDIRWSSGRCDWVETMFWGDLLLWGNVLGCCWGRQAFNNSCFLGGEGRLLGTLESFARQEYLTLVGLGRGLGRSSILGWGWTRSLLGRFLVVRVKGASWNRQIRFCPQRSFRK